MLSSKMYEELPISELSLRDCYTGREIKRLCGLGTLRLVSRISHGPAEVVDGSFQKHLTELQPPATHAQQRRAYAWLTRRQF
jgi:hypothetical protein